jgi:hypothetical protein
MGPRRVPPWREGDAVVMRRRYFPQYETPYRNLKKSKNAVRIHALILGNGKLSAKIVLVRIEIGRDANKRRRINVSSTRPVDGPGRK